MLDHLLLVVPVEVLYVHVFPFLNVTSFCSLLATSKTLALSFAVPLTDLTFARFTCPDHNTFARLFIGGPTPSPFGIHGAVGDTTLSCNFCAVPLCQKPLFGPQKREVDGQIVFRHGCGRCGLSLCNDCLWSEMHSK